MAVETVEAFLQKIMSISSLTGQEAALGNFLADYLEAEGFDVVKMPVDGERNNIYARVGKPAIVLQAHMDVVPPFIPPTEDEEWIYGRGACDTKGSIAAMIQAAIEAKKKGIENFGVLFTVDEEVGFSGAQTAAQFVEDLGAYLVVGEPSQLRPVNAHYGILVFSIECRGKSAHSSEPQLGENAIDALVTILSEDLDRLEVAKSTLLSVVTISGGVADNVIPDRAEALVSFRISPGDTRQYATEFQQIIGKRGTVKAAQSLPPVFTQIPSSLDFLGEGQSVKYCTELSFFKNGVVLGPGDIAVAHRPDEKVRKVDLRRAQEIYVRILREYRA